MWPALFLPHSLFQLAAWHHPGVLVTQVSVAADGGGKKVHDALLLARVDLRTRILRGCGLKIVALRITV